MQINYPQNIQCDTSCLKFLFVFNTSKMYVSMMYYSKLIVYLLFKIAATYYRLTESE